MASNWSMRHGRWMVPHTAESLLSATQAIGELYRYLAHATISTACGALASFPNLYPIFPTLTAATYSNEQFLHQLAVWAEHFTESDATIRHDDAPDDPTRDRAASALLQATEYLCGAARFANQIGANLSHASGHLNHIYHEDAWVVDRGEP